MFRYRAAISLPLLPVLFLAACADTPDRDRPIEEAPILYSCDDGRLVAAVFVDGRDSAVLLSVDGAPSVRLPLEESGSGARYSDGATTFWTQGEGEAMLGGPSGETTCTVER